MPEASLTREKGTGGGHGSSHGESQQPGTPLVPPQDRAPGANPRPFLRRGGIAASFSAAVAGVLRTVASQRNMKIHVVAGLMVMIVGMALPLELETRVALLFAVAIVFFAEILNTALEAIVDILVAVHHPLAMLAKDAAAAGVLVFAATTVLVLAEILWLRWQLVTDNLDAVWRAVALGVPLVLSEALGLFVALGRRTQLLRGLVSLALLAPLVWTSRDPIYATVAVILVVTAFAARYRADALTAAMAAPFPRGAPHGP